MVHYHVKQRDSDGAPDGSEEGSGRGYGTELAFREGFLNHNSQGWHDETHAASENDHIKVSNKRGSVHPHGAHQIKSQRSDQHPRNKHILVPGAQKDLGIDYACSDQGDHHRGASASFRQRYAQDGLYEHRNEHNCAEHAQTQHVRNSEYAVLKQLEIENRFFDPTSPQPNRMNKTVDAPKIL